MYLFLSLPNLFFYCSLPATIFFFFSFYYCYSYYDHYSSRPLLLLLLLYSYYYNHYVYFSYYLRPPLPSQPRPTLSPLSIVKLPGWPNNRV